MKEHRMTGLIARFNPHEMARQDVLAVSTGREKELRRIMQSIRSNRDINDAPNEHILVTGQRGMGKSFLMRRLEIELEDEPGVHFVLLPEELPHIFSPDAWLDEVAVRIGDQPGYGNNALWDSDDSGESWENSLAELLNKLDDTQPEALLVVAVENLDLLLASAFRSKTAQSRFRTLLEHNFRFMLVASSLKQEIDGDYSERLFHAFHRLNLSPWEAVDHVTYLKARADHAQTEETQAKANKIRAYSEFTGGSPRIAMVLADLLIHHDEVQEAAINIQALVDELSEYYQDLLKRIPPQSMKLFDSLIRGGEPCSQSELARRVGTTQNKISRHFIWLRDFGYIRGLAKIKGRKDISYQVTDRVFVQFYRMRFLYHGKHRSPLVSMSDFLADYYDHRERQGKARDFLDQGAEPEARLFVDMNLEAMGVALEGINTMDTESLCDVLEFGKFHIEGETHSIEDLDRFETDEELRDFCQRVLSLLRNCKKHLPVFDGEEMAVSLEQSLGLSTYDKAHTALFLLSPEGVADKWGELVAKFEKANGTKDAPGALTALRETRAVEIQYPVSFRGFLRTLSKAKEAQLAGDHLLALDHFNDVLISAETFGLTDKTAQILSHMGQSQQALENHQLAIEKYEDSALLYRELNDTGRLAWSLALAGWSQKALGRHGRAIEKHTESALLYRELNDKRRLALNLAQIGWSQKELGHHDLAIEMHSESASLCRELNDKSQLAWNLGWVGWSQSSLEFHDLAIETHTESASLCRELNDKSQFAWNLGQVARNRWHVNGDDRAWQEVDRLAESLKRDKSEDENTYLAIQQLADVVYDLGKREDPSGVDRCLHQLFDSLRTRAHLDFSQIVRLWVIGWITMIKDESMLRRIIEIAKQEAGESLEEVCDIALLTLDYLSSPQPDAFLQTLNPDQASTVLALVRESGRQA